MTAEVSTEQLKSLLVPAAVLRWLARGFTYPHPGHIELLQQEATPLDRPGLSPESRTALEAALALLSDCTEEELAGEHIRLFTAKGVCSLHETAYGDGRRMGGQPVELADIGGFYKAFGLEPSPAQPDLPDHLCMELEFYSLVLVKQAYALAEGWSEQAEIAAQAGEKFLVEHLGRWIPPLVASIREQAGAESWHAAIGQLLQSVIADECTRLGVTPQPFSARMVADEEVTGDTFTCPRDEIQDDSSAPLV
ncbi:MAG: molecular chaperone TorD family protein [Magnetococcales bacterium]|nr:molecular chaperone TorD family protein [Magnetococcales bacterium]